MGDRRDFGSGDRSKLAKGEGDWFHPAARGGAVVDAEAELAGAFPDAKSEVAAESAVAVEFVFQGAELVRFSSAAGLLVVADGDCAELPRGTVLVSVCFFFGVGIRGARARAFDLVRVIFWL